MSPSAATLTNQQFVLSEDWKMFEGSSAIPLHKGQNVGDMVVYTNADNVTASKEEIKITLRRGGTVKVGDHKGYEAIRSTVVRITASEVKAV
jgi:hypothetical protein